MVMSAESNARSHAQAFRWWVGNPEMSKEEACMRDLLALHQATAELIREQRDFLGYHGTDLELFSDGPRVN